jgi:excisionase family DNA binding protein
MRRHNVNRALIAIAVCHATGNVAESWEQSDSRLTVTVDNVAERLSISRAFGYEALARGEIPRIQVDRRILLPKVGLERIRNACSKG